jgi:hypothetical protein
VRYNNIMLRILKGPSACVFVQDFSCQHSLSSYNDIPLADNDNNIFGDTARAARYASMHLLSPKG